MHAELSKSPLTRGLVDTNIIILRSHIDPVELPDKLAISSITLAELSAGVHAVPDGSDRMTSGGVFATPRSSTLTTLSGGTNPGTRTKCCFSSRPALQNYPKRYEHYTS